MFTSLKHVINNTNRVSSACLGSLPTSVRAGQGETHRSLDEIARVFALIVLSLSYVHIVFHL